MNLRRHLAVQIKMRRHKHRLRTQPFRRCHRHGRVQTEFACFIRSGTNDRPRTVPRHNDGQPFQVRLLAQFYRSVECVHIDMDDFALGHGKRWIRKRLIVTKGRLKFQTASMFKPYFLLESWSNNPPSAKNFFMISSHGPNFSFGLNVSISGKSALCFANTSALRGRR